MKSQLFSKNAWLSADRFKKDLKKLSALDEDVITELPNIVMEIHLADTDDEGEEIYSASAKRLGIDEYLLKSNFQLIGTLIKEFSPDGDAKNDSIESIIQDIKDSDIIEKSNLGKLTKLLNIAKKLGQEEFHKADKRKEYQESGLPTLVGISGTTNLRAVFKKPYKSTLSIEDYAPECEGLVPVVTVKLRLEDSPHENVFFQMSPSQIRLVINNLVALEKQMDSTINFTDMGAS